MAMPVPTKAIVVRLLTLMALVNLVVNLVNAQYCILKLSDAEVDNGDIDVLIT